MSEVDGPGPSPRPSAAELAARVELAELFRTTPIPPESILDHLEVYMRPQRITELVALDALYRRILDVHGVVMEFGVRWGRHLSVFSALRATHEPTNFYRRLIGFDTFVGLHGVAGQDGTSPRVHEGAMAVAPGYESHLWRVLELHEAESAMAHIRRFELRKGDAPEQLAAYLAEHPDTVIALAYFDLDLYEPTRACLELLLPHVVRGSVLAFDEFMHPDFPGEALAVKEVLDLRRHRLERFDFCPYPAFVVL